MNDIISRDRIASRAGARHCKPDCSCARCLDDDMQLHLIDTGLVNELSADALKHVFGGSVLEAPQLPMGGGSGTRMAAPVRRLSERQLNFIKVLLASRDSSALQLRGVDLMKPEEIPANRASDVIEKLKECPIIAPAADVPTEGQVKYLLNLVDRKYATEQERIIGRKLITKMNKQQASSAIDRLQKMPDVNVEEDLKEGVYRYEGGAARVVRSDNGRMYAGLWNEETEEWGYDRGLIRNIKAEDRMTLEEISAFGQAFGRCGHCNKKLTRKASMERGIGPKCATMY